MDRASTCLVTITVDFSSLRVRNYKKVEHKQINDFSMSLMMPRIYVFTVILSFIAGLLRLFS